MRSDLVDEGGMSVERVRAVSYGEGRLVKERTGPGRSGIESRRLTCFVELSGQVGG